MATAELTIEQILNAVQRWPSRQRQALLAALAQLPNPAKARATVRRVRARHRMGTKKQRRMSHLLAKGNAGTISAIEKKELDTLVEEFEVKTLAMAQDMLAQQVTGTPRRSQSRLGAD